MSCHAITRMSAVRFGSLCVRAVRKRKAVRAVGEVRGSQMLRLTANASVRGHPVLLCLSVIA